jgi:hypothetical protein
LEYKKRNVNTPEVKDAPGSLEQYIYPRWGDERWVVSGPETVSRCLGKGARLTSHNTIGVGGKKWR